MLASVIIPVYNVAKYLDECVNNVITQSYSDLEILLVDDGSTDESGTLCDAWAKKDSRIHVIHKENGGLSDARNVGVAAATGEYVLFLDSDDFWDDPCAVERLAARVQQSRADVVNFSYKKFEEGSEQKTPYFQNMIEMPLGLSKEEQLQFLSEHRVYIASACNKLIKRSLLDKTMLFKKGVYSEDIEWCARLLAKAQSMDFVCEDFYCYRQRSGSISHALRDKNCSDLVDAVFGCLGHAKAADGYTQEALMQYTAFQFSTFFVTQALAENYQKGMIAKMKAQKWVMKYHGGNKKIRVLRVSCAVIGYTMTCRLLRLLYSSKRPKKRG